MRFETIKDATRAWIGEFNAFPITMIEKLITLEPNSWYEITPNIEESETDFLPMWGWIWQMTDICDTDWLENNLEEVAECGFRIYESDEFGLFIGIDGAGYDFYKEHWIPLYKARGLQWHKTEQ